MYSSSHLLPLDAVEGARVARVIDREDKGVLPLCSLTIVIGPGVLAPCLAVVWAATAGWLLLPFRVDASIVLWPSRDRPATTRNRRERECLYWINSEESRPSRLWEGMQTRHPPRFSLVTPWAHTTASHAVARTCLSSAWQGRQEQMNTGTAWWAHNRDEAASATRRGISA